MSSEVQQVMAYYEELQARKDAELLDYTQRRDAILTPEQRHQLLALEIEHNGQLDEIAEEEEKVEKRLRELVVEHGKTVNGQRFQAVYKAGSRRLDTKATKTWLERNAPDALPDLLAEGKPTVALGTIKKGKD